MCNDSFTEGHWTKEGDRAEIHGMILAKTSPRLEGRIVRLEVVREKGKNPYKLTRREIETALRRLIRTARR